MEIFRTRLRACLEGTDEYGRTWVYVPYDQLADQIGPLSRLAPDRAGIVLVESSWKAARRPYHQQKLALVLANQRHFALEQARRGVAVRYVATRASYDVALREVAAEIGPLLTMEPAERELRRLLEPLLDEGVIEPHPHEGWLTSAETFRAAAGEPPWRMDAFYRAVRRQTGILMDDGQPAGGKYSHDADNRKPWNGDPPAPSPPTFDPDDITTEVGALIEARYAHHPGRVDLTRLPARAEDAEKTWHRAKSVCMRHFGPYEDAMSVASPTLFHTLISPLLNLHRLLPCRVLHDVLRLEMPLNSQEGFVRQLLGWREFVRHVHRATDGFRDLPGGVPTRAAVPGDAGWARSVSDAEAEAPSTHPRLDGGVAPSRRGCVDEPVPAALWGTPSGLRCLDTVVRGVLETGYSHHITRLMVVANLGTLLDWSPRALTDWFWCAYIDAYDWVVEPNVLGMGTYAVGDLMTTKPYVSGAAYIDRMSDFCGDCDFHPRKSCPITHLYWAYLDRHRDTFHGNHRLRLPLASLDKRDRARRARDAAVFEAVRGALRAGERLDPDALAARLGEALGG